MEQLISNFEKDLKTKLLYKTSGHMTEEILLLKNFKYFDEDNTNVCSPETFIKVISKVGVLSITEEDLLKLFSYYSNNQKVLYYKDFIGQIFNNESLKLKNEVKPPEEQQQEPEKQEEEIDPIDNLILKVREVLIQNGIENLIKLEERLRELDENNQQELDIKLFGQICTEFNFGLTQEEVEDLFLSFDKEEKGMINYDDFIRVIRGELSERRKELVHNVFKQLDIDNKGSLTIEELLNIFIPKGSLECLKEKKSEEQAMECFEYCLKANHKYLNGDEGDTKPVDIDEFEDLYESISLMIPNDDMFREIILRCWGLLKDEPEEEKVVEEKEEKVCEKNDEEINDVENVEEDFEKNEEKLLDEEKEFRKKILNEENIDLFRTKIGARGIVVLIRFVEQLKQYDRQGNKELNLEDFKDIINNAKIIMSEDEINDLFNDFVETNSIYINYEKFLKKLILELNQRRSHIVNEAFKKLDVENCGIIDISEVKSAFSSKNSPIVREGVMSEEAFYSSFIETFQSHHNFFRSAKIKKVNYAEFEDYYKYVSITIEDDYLFEEMLITCWKLTKSIIAHKGPKDNVKEIIGNPELEKPNNEEVKKHNFKSSKKCYPFVKKSQTPYGVDNKNVDYSNNLHPKGDLNGIKLSKTDDILTFFKKKIISRGPRGIMSMRRTFMLYDENKNNKLKKKDFHKFLDDYRYNIPEKMEEELFNLFDHNKLGSINYIEFITTLIGKMNNFRKLIIEKVFAKLDIDKQGKIPYNAIIENYNIDKHPEVLNGQRTKQEALARFIDFFEYHFNLLNPDKDCGCVTLEEFCEFYNYISILIDDDKYFENMMTRLWGIGNNENFGKISRFVKYNSKYY